MISEREAFGPSLRAERDRRGISLQDISDSTKISVSFLAALERNDVSRWPKGIFRRAFVREYVTAIGLPPEPVVAEFVRLFPDGGPIPEIVEPGELRLTFDDSLSTKWGAARPRVTAAAVESAGIVTLGALVGWALNTSILLASGVIALIYYPLATICLERTPKPRLLYLPTIPVRWLTGPSDTPSGASEAAPTTSAPEWHTASN